MRKFAIPFVLLLLCSLGVSADTSTPASIGASGVVSENFNSLAASGSSATTPTGWGFVESGTSTANNGQYVAGTGSGNAGDTYSFGALATADRALGQVRSGTLVSIIGGAFQNNTGSSITSMLISYAGEQWRLGATGRTVAERLDFQYSLDATALNNGTWTDVNALDFTPPVTAGTVGALDGNVQRVVLSSTISGLNIPAGAIFYIRWTDVDASGADDGLAIDDFTLSVGDVAPSVSSTTPVAGSSNVLVSSAITINFSENVTNGPGAFSLACNLVPQAFTQSPAAGTAATSFTLTPAANLPFSSNCVAGVVAAQISDTDTNDPPDHMAADFSVSFDTEPEADVAPQITSTNPGDGAIDVEQATNITINFSESMTATLTAFTIDCGTGAIEFGQTSGASASFVLDPNVSLPPGAVCNVTVKASNVSDLDANDPPDHLAADYAFSFTTGVPPATNVMINEIDSDTPGSGVDTAEFVELYDGGVGNTPLNGLTVVFYNGNGDVSYAAFDLDGKTTDANGYFTLGNPGVPGVDLVFDPGATGFLQNGADAVALVIGNASSFPNGTSIAAANVLDAVVYDTDDADDPGLLPLLNAGQPQVNENGGGDGPNQSVGRCANGTGGARNTFTYKPGVPSPDGPNNCPPVQPPSNIVISQFYGSGGVGGAVYQNDFVELYNKSDSETVDITGWTLQYAAAAGSGWDFNKTPLGGPIGPHQYYLVKLASNGAVGAVLPDANISGPINMSGSNGKIALVANGDSLAGLCPLANPNLRDFAGYGTADCGEGNTKAPALTNVTADFRLNGGATDTDSNGDDFTSAGPAPRRTAPIVELGPFLVSSDPSNNGLNVPKDPTIVLTFSEPVTTTDPFFTLTCNLSGPHTYQQTGSGLFVDLTINEPLTPAEKCTITLMQNGVHDVDTDDAGNTDTLPYNYSWQFTVATGADAPYPPEVHLAFGNPSDATADLANFSNYLMEKPAYALSYNRDDGRPNWVSWHLASEWYGSLARVDTFRADPLIPAESPWYRVQGFDFSGSGFDRGHMVPNADRDKENAIPINQATYLMTNMVAQAPGNNQGPWADMEGYLRTLADAGNELYIVAGPAGIGGTGSNGLKTDIAGGHVKVPASTWKVALVLPKAGGDDVARASCATRSIAVIMPNEELRPHLWTEFVTTIDAVESLTGYDFFSNLPPDVAYCVEAFADGETRIPDVTPPVIQCDAADGAWHADNVTLACTATDPESGLAHGGDASFTLSTLVPGGTEDGNATTDSRVVCDAVGNCATAVVSGNKIDRTIPTASISSPVNGASYALNAVANASFTCADTGSGVATCAGSSADGAAIDTASTGPKTFEVTVTDVAGNTSSASVSYTVTNGPAHKRTPGISITNIPSSAVKGGSFTPTYSYDGDGNIHLRTLTPSACTVKADSVVQFIGAGTCTLVPWATASGSVNPAQGAPQSFAVAP